LSEKWSASYTPVRLIRQKIRGILICQTAIVFKSFKKCGISNSLDGTQDSLLCEDSDDSIPDSEELSSVSSSEVDDFCGFEDED
jgi:hypothetical protein